mgnify:CR=1 FL=1
MIQNYKIVTLCGSTRFKEQFIEAQKRLTLEGCIDIGESTKREIAYAEKTGKIAVHGYTLGAKTVRR